MHFLYGDLYTVARRSVTVMNKHNLLLTGQSPYTMCIENIIQTLTVYFAGKYVNPLANSINRSLLESGGVVKPGVKRVKQDLRCIRASLKSQLLSITTMSDLKLKADIYVHFSVLLLHVVRHSL